MENLELITFDENGQGVINFESLEAVTSKEFVEGIKSDLEQGYVVVNINSEFHEKIGEYAVEVYLKSFYGFIIHKCLYGSLYRSTFGDYDLKMLGLEVVSK